MSLFVLRLKGIDDIARFVGFNHAQVIDWIFYCDFPATKIDGEWISKKSDVKKWLKRFKPKRPLEQLTVRLQNSRKAKEKKRW